MEGLDTFDDDASKDDALDRDGGAVTPGGGGRVEVAREARTLDPSDGGSSDEDLTDAEGETVSAEVEGISTESNDCEPSGTAADFVSDSPSACARLIIACVSSTTL